MKRIARVCVLAGCGIAAMTIAAQPGQKTSMEGARACASTPFLECGGSTPLCFL